MPEPLEKKKNRPGYESEPERRERKRARDAINGAVRYGTIKVGPCRRKNTGQGKCTGRVVAHHYRGYDKANALKVHWYCDHHHTQVHSEVGDRAKYKTSKAADPELLEDLAELEHERWSRWEIHREEAAQDPANLERWKVQRETPFDELSEPDKERDREEARRTVELLEQRQALAPEALAKAELEGGIHQHAVDRAHLVTMPDGNHSHVFMLPDGTIVATELDGAHQHELASADADTTTEGGEHAHMIKLPDGTVMATGAGVSKHAHELQVAATAIDGLHPHTLELATGTIVSLTPGEFAALAKQDVADEQKTIDFQGIALVIDRPVGFVQTGTAPDGTEWQREFTLDNGFIQGTRGGDGEGLDIFVGPELEAPVAYWITQRDAEGTFDEFKVMLGFASQSAAIDGYLAHVPAEFLAGVQEVSVQAMKALLGLEPEVVIQQATMKALDDLHAAMKAGDLEPDVGALRESVARSLLLDLYKAEPEGITKAIAEIAAGAGAPMFALEDYRPQVLDVASSRVCKLAGDADVEEQTVLGIVLEPDIVDSQGDTYTAQTIKETAHLWLTDYRNIGLQHKALVNRHVKVVESYIAPVDMVIEGTTVKAGTWLLKVRIEDAELWAQVKSGELTGFSIAGFATKTPVAA